jgi:indolepyruvate ferredoxin oxidoreductase beta subunit
MNREFNLIAVGMRRHDLVRIAQIIGYGAAKDGLNFVGTDHTFVSIEIPVEISHLRIGNNIYGPFVPKGKCDLLLGFIPGESARIAAEYLADNGDVIINSKDIEPALFFPPYTRYPNEEEIFELLTRVANRVKIIDALSLAREAGDQDFINLVMLGALAGYESFPIKVESIRKSIEEITPKDELSVSIKAFEIGFEEIRK